jgi:hypothetical protein
MTSNTEQDLQHEQERHADNRFGDRRCGIPGGGSERVSDM